MAKNKHITDSERLQIEQALRDGISIKRIAVKIGKSASTISREIRARAIDSDKYAAYRIHNRCAKKTVCQKEYLCADKPNCGKKCARCNYCNAVCEEYEEQTLFPVVLTDNGSEFSNPKMLEADGQGNQRTKVFYCDPYSSFQKPSVELNHEFIRKVVPKGASFDGLVQSDVDLMISHINSYSREKLNDKSPFDMFGFLFGHRLLKKLGVSKIPPNEIMLTPALLKK
jgi:IS30 family transposase